MANIVDINELREFLRGQDPVHFSYRKTDGTIREAVGTLNPDLIPSKFAPKETSKRGEGYWAQAVIAKRWVQHKFRNSRYKGISFAFIGCYNHICI
mgnify:CR=1 FL=1